MSDPIQAYPLCWPHGWPRMAPHRRTAGRFRSRDRGSVTIAQGVGRVLNELGLMGVREDDIVVSTNVKPTLAGLPSSKDRVPQDPGVAVYWSKRGQTQRCMAIDRYTTVADNLAAIAATLDAMRAIERHGGAEILDRAFTGFVALPSPEQPWQVLGIPMEASRDQVEQAYRRLAMTHHPDRGGDAGEMARVNAARDAMMERARA